VTIEIDVNVTIYIVRATAPSELARHGTLTMPLLHVADILSHENNRRLCHRWLCMRIKAANRSARATDEERRPGRVLRWGGRRGS